LENLNSKSPTSVASELDSLSQLNNNSLSPRGSRKSEGKEGGKESLSSLLSPRTNLTARATSLLATDRPKSEKSGYMSGRLASKSKLQHAQRKSKADLLKEQREQKEKKIQGVKDQASCFSQQIQDGLTYLLEVASL
jgi:hypothetical protein